jgi:hypothetical protein
MIFNNCFHGYIFQCPVTPTIITRCLFQVLKLKVDLVSHLALNSVFSKRSAEYCLADLVDKIGDAKNGSAVQEALSCIAEATTLDFVAVQVSEYCAFLVCPLLAISGNHLRWLWLT